jgi:N6-L-threonylcarbamoyladenine synthase
MLVLGIETSCDETAAAVVQDGKRILSDVVVSQIETHKEFGGVVPELASRMHIQSISFVIEEALRRAGIVPRDIQGIGVTRGPGLIGSLLVGIGAAKGMAMALKIPLSGVNHLHGHLFAPFLEREEIAFPFVGLVVSGGHTSLFHVRGPLELDLIGKTRDDAAGEAFDKVAKLLGLGYPGGVAIEEHARHVDPGELRFPRALMEPDEPDFSFSGLKTAVLRHVEERFGVKSPTNVPGSFHPVLPENPSDEILAEIRAIASAFQEAVTEVLVVKGLSAARRYRCKTLIVCGGVAANQALRTKMNERGRGEGIEPIFPSMSLCTDNAAMIAARAEILLNAGMSDSLDIGAKSRW